MMNKILIMLSMCLFLQSCTMVMVGEPYQKKQDAIEASMAPLPTDDLTCVEVNTSTGTYTIDKAGYVGIAYQESCDCCLMAGLYGHGSSTWNDEYEEWLNGDSQESPDKFNDIDGIAFNESVNAAEDAARL